MSLISKNTFIMLFFTLHNSLHFDVFQLCGGKNEPEKYMRLNEWRTRQGKKTLSQMIK